VQSQGTAGRRGVLLLTKFLSHLRARTS